MTTNKSFKLLVRARMAKTGESYTAARAQLLRAVEPLSPAEKPPLATSDEAIRARTGRGWEEWFDLLDAWGAADRSHREIAREVATRLEIAPLAWNAQAVASSYERARGLRQVGEFADGFRVTTSRTVAVPVDRLFDAVVEPSLRALWLPDADLRERTARRPRTAHFEWADGPSRVHVTFDVLDPAKSRVALRQERLASAADANRMRTYWRDRVATLKEVLER